MDIVPRLKNPWYLPLDKLVVVENLKKLTTCVCQKMCHICLCLCLLLFRAKVEYLKLA